MNKKWLSKGGSRRGFTLIELLVVIAIIGILSSVVLVSLNSARQKGRDTRIISDVQQTRTAFESGFSSNYVDVVQTSGTGAQTAVAGSLKSGSANYANLTLLATDAVTNGGLLTYVVTTSATDITTAYAIYGQLVSNSARYFCIDSTGNTNPSAIAHTGITCPAIGS